MSVKDKVLEALEKEKGNYISGEALAVTLKVSRNAVWKSINELKKKGYRISSVSNRGYMLEEDNDIISAAGILASLKKLSADESPDALNVKINVYKELDSTNNEAKRSVLFEGPHLIHKNVIIAVHQTAGRGHGEKDFDSPDGGIYLSILLEPSKIKYRSKSITEVIAEVMIKVIIFLFNKKPDRKSDNSLYFGEDKICGILTEGISDLETGIYSNYIVGIGIPRSSFVKHDIISKDKNYIIAIILNEIYKTIDTEK
ncbi:MAG: HTH domain-containing protein [Lachnospiraceae bacterium]|nr:HTH domain-containing protein [Lachnospiraceae bacterium]